MSVCGGLALDGCQVSPKPLHHTLPQLHIEEKKYHERLMGQGKGREGSLTNYHHGQNRLTLGKLTEFISKQMKIGY